MNFLELKEQFEIKLKNDYKFVLLDLHYSPYAFGSGMSAYKINGKIIKLIFNGRENVVELVISNPHDKYPNASWTTIFSGLPADFIDFSPTKLLAI